MALLGDGVRRQRKAAWITGKGGVHERFHPLVIHQQFCRWLLSSVDREPANELWLTQEAIAGMLGVRRETITKEVGALLASGVITNGRGRIVVIDRPGLEAQACECYRETNREFGRLLTGTSAFYGPDGRAPGRYLLVPGAAARAHLAETVSA